MYSFHCKLPLPFGTASVCLHSADFPVLSQIDRVNELFVAAREEIDYAQVRGAARFLNAVPNQSPVSLTGCHPSSLQEDAETTYFNESVDTARGAVADAFEAYDAVLGELSEGERAKLQRAMGLKMEQLKVCSA